MCDFSEVLDSMKLSLFSTAGAEDPFASDVTEIFAIGLAVKVMSPPSRGGPHATLACWEDRMRPSIILHY